MNTFIQQGCIKVIKSDSNNIYKGIYNDVPWKIHLCGYVHTKLPHVL